MIARPAPLVCAVIVVALAGCSGAQGEAPVAGSSPAATGSSASPSATGSPVSSPTGTTVIAPAAGCGDPTAHVYHPYRLQLLDRCRTVTGVIVAVRSEADGDFHVRLAVDSQFNGMLRPANYSGEHGDLVLEPICQHEVTQADAVGPCQGGVPLVPIPPIGTHVSATGTYVLDNDHGGWAELHPLFEIHPG